MKRVTVLFAVGGLMIGLAWLLFPWIAERIFPQVQTDYNHKDYRTDW